MGAWRDNKIVIGIFPALASFFTVPFLLMIGFNLVQDPTIAILIQGKPWSQFPIFMFLSLTAIIVPVLLNIFFSRVIVKPIKVGNLKTYIASWEWSLFSSYILGYAIVLKYFIGINQTQEIVTLLGNPVFGIPIGTLFIVCLAFVVGLVPALATRLDKYQIVPDVGDLMLVAVSSVIGISTYFVYTNWILPLATNLL